MLKHNLGNWTANRSFLRVCYSRAKLFREHLADQRVREHRAQRHRPGGRVAWSTVRHSASSTTTRMRRSA